MIKHSRRSVLKKSALLTPGAILTRNISPLISQTDSEVHIKVTEKKEIISTAVDSAISAGASYADARLTKNESFYVGDSASPLQQEKMAFGVRALYQGYWGFAAGPVWSQEEAARLGRAAVAQAKANVLGRERITELAPMEITNGHWETPVKDDPFKIDYYELKDFHTALRNFAVSLKHLKNPLIYFVFTRTNKAFGSSMDQFTTQTLYQSSGTIKFQINDLRGGESIGSVDEVSIAGLGFEYFRDRPLRDYLRKAHEESLNDLELPWMPIDPGRYVTLIDQNGVANLLHQSVGKATQVDRVFGFEANAGGTSYITDPENMLNNFKIGSKAFNVYCDRSEVGSAGRVKWDDEGVQPIKYDLVKDGVLANLQTNREGASWIKEHYDNTKQNLRSFGVASSPSALDVQLTHLSDLYLKPVNSSGSRDNLRESVDKGIEFRGTNISLDFQQISGWTQGGRAYQIKNGKRAARYGTAGILFRTPELWNGLVETGGEESVSYFGLESKKGQPEQTFASGVYVPPALFKDMTIIDVTRKA